MRCYLIFTRTLDRRFVIVTVIQEWNPEAGCLVLSEKEVRVGFKLRSLIESPCSFSKISLSLPLLPP